MRAGWRYWHGHTLLWWYMYRGVIDAWVIFNLWTPPTWDDSRWQVVIKFNVIDDYMRIMAIPEDTQ